MNRKEKNLYNFCNELITIFTEYVTILDAYFSDLENRADNQFLFDEYMELGRQLKIIEERYKK